MSGGFYISGFGPGFYVAGGGPPPVEATVSRVVLEALAVMRGAVVSRDTAEVLAVMPGTAVSRAVAELLGVMPGVLVTRDVAEAVVVAPPLLGMVSRIAAEVITESGFAVPIPHAEVTRVALEVLGYAAELLGKDVQETRIAVEVLVTQALRRRGLVFEGIPVDTVHIGLAIDLELTKPGYFGLTDASGNGYSLSWATASPATITETWRKGSTVVTSTFLAPTGRLIRQFEATTPGGALALTDLAGLRPDNQLGSGVLQELMVWDRALTGPEVLRINDYLTCKWVTVGCTPQISAPFPACVS